MEARCRSPEEAHCVQKAIGSAGISFAGIQISIFEFADINPRRLPSIREGQNSK
jgi:hypothetical protein